MLPRSLVALAGVAFLLTGCAMGSSKTTTVTVTSPAVPKKPSGALGETANVKYFGLPTKMKPVDVNLYALTIKPQFFLVGVTANVAFAHIRNSACDPLLCPAVEDDRLVIPAGKQKLVFLMTADTTGTVLMLPHPDKPTTITAVQLNTLVGGRMTPKLFEPLESGLWLTVDGDKVMSFAQQYQP